MSTFPLKVPQNCPLPTAVDCDHVVYRACKGNPPGEGDFLTHEEQGLAPNAKGDAACMRFGLSVFPSREDCEHMLSVFPGIGNHVAAGILKPVHGKIADTPGRFPEHMTWWPYDGVQRLTPFK